MRAHTLSFPRETTSHKGKQDHPRTPYVDCRPLIGLLIDDFRCRVEGRPAVRLKVAVRSDKVGQTKIIDLNFVVFGEEKVLRLEISV